MVDVSIGFSNLLIAVLSDGKLFFDVVVANCDASQMVFVTTERFYSSSQNIPLPDGGIVTYSRFCSDCFSEGAHALPRDHSECPRALVRSL